MNRQAWQWREDESAKQRRARRTASKDRTPSSKTLESRRAARAYLNYRREAS